MSKMPKTMILPSTEAIEFLRSLPDPMFREELLDFLKSLLDMLQQSHRQTREFAESGGWQTKNWRGKEDENGDLIIEHKNATTGAWERTGWKLSES